MTGEIDPVIPIGSGSVAPELSPPAPSRATRGRWGPSATPAVGIDLPETLRYRLKNMLLGPPAGQRAAQRRAAVQAPRPRRAVPRRHLLLGLRHRGDAHPAGAARRAWPPSPWCCPMTMAILGVMLLRDPLLPRGRHGLHQGRRLLRGGPGELRPAGRPGRRRGAAHRLRGHRGGADRGGHRRPDHCLPAPSARTTVPITVGRRPAAALRQPARHPGGGQGLRPAHLPVHPQPGTS